MATAQLKAKCKELLARRSAPATPWYYIARDWKRQLTLTIGFLAVAGGLWWMDWRLASVGFLAFFVGRVVRDLRWLNALAKEWPSTAELIDWPRVEAIAGETHSED